MGKVGLTLGADPEFELVFGEEVIPARKILREDIAVPWGVISEDGSGHPLELRPKPSADPETLVRNVGRSLLSVPRVMGVAPSTVGEKYPIGGHVHIGGAFSWASAEELVMAIDDLMGDLFHRLSPEVRLKEGYGRRGDWRKKDWGFEYRTPPASVWSHPMVALEFLRDVQWVAEKFISGENPLKDPMAPLVRANAERAAEFVLEHGGRLHWGAWKAYVGKWPGIGDSRETPEVKISFGPNTEHDESLLEDAQAMCARLGLPFVRIMPFDRRDGDHASNVPGDEELAYGFTPYPYGGRFWLSWRFRNDPEFRRGEIPKMEATIAYFFERMGDIERQGGGRLVKEVVPFSGGWPEEETEAGELDEGRSFDLGVGVRGRGREVEM